MSTADFTAMVRETIDTLTNTRVSVSSVTRGAIDHATGGRTEATVSQSAKAIRRRSEPGWQDGKSILLQRFSVAAADLPFVPKEKDTVVDPHEAIPGFTQKTYTIREVERKCQGAMLDLICVQER